MDDSLTWIIFGLGYIPMHFMVPLILVFMTGNETPEDRKALLKYVVIEGLVTLIAIGLLAYLLLGVSTTYALAILLIGPFVPLAGLWWYRRQRGTQWRVEAGTNE